MIFAIFKKLDLLKPGNRLLHVAPEKALVAPFFKVFGSRYTVADVRKDALAGLKNGIEKVVVDMTDISPAMAKRRFDIVLHSHILEHLRASWPLALLWMDALVRPGGHHVFAIPIVRDWSSEDLADLSKEKRTRAFGQFDHMRYIGRKDFEIDMRAIAKIAEPDFIKSSTDILSAEEMNTMAGDKDVFVIKKRSDERPWHGLWHYFHGCPVAAAPASGEPARSCDRAVMPGALASLLRRRARPSPSASARAG